MVQVLIDNDTIVVAAPTEDSNATGVNGDESNNDLSNSGAVYVFKKNTNGDWEQEAYLKPSNPSVNSYFGDFSISIKGDIIVVGSAEHNHLSSIVENTNGSPNVLSADDSVGSVYVFKRKSNGVWEQDAYIKASNARENGRFGSAVAIDKETIFVGSYGEASNATGVNGDETNHDMSRAGAVYIFENKLN